MPRKAHFFSVGVALICRMSYIVSMESIKTETKTTKEATMATKINDLVIRTIAGTDHICRIEQIRDGYYFARVTGLDPYCGAPLTLEDGDFTAVPESESFIHHTGLVALS